MEISLKHFGVSKHDFSSSFLCVFDEHAFIVLPVIFEEVKVGEIKAALKLEGVIVVYFSESVELVLTPVSLIGEFSAFIVKFAPSVHLVIPPLSLIVASVLIEELAMSVSFCIELVPLVARASLILLNYVLMIGEVDVMFCVPDSRLRILRVLISHLHNRAVVFVLVGPSDRRGLSVVYIFVVAAFIVFVGRKLHLVVNVVRAPMHVCVRLLLLRSLFLVLGQSRLALCRTCLFLLSVVFCIPVQQ